MREGWRASEGEMEGERGSEAERLARGLRITHQLHQGCMKLLVSELVQ